MTKKSAIFPGSFDPFTAGHFDIVMRGLDIFDTITIAVGYNIQKGGLLHFDARLQLIKDTFVNEPRVNVISYTGLTVDLCQSIGIKFLLRGIRSSVDFEYERGIDHVNRVLYPQVESVILMTNPNFAIISSSIVRELVAHGADTTKFMPKGIELKKYL